MLYQEMLMGDTPYFIIKDIYCICKMHRHPEIELHYCLSGSYELIVDQTTYRMQEGDMVIIGSMVPHSVNKRDASEAQEVVIGIGPVMLMENFMEISRMVGEYIVCSMEDPRLRRMRDLFEEIYRISDARDAAGKMLIRGDLYTLCAMVMTYFSNRETLGHANTKNVELVDKVYELIRTRYAEQLTVDYVAEFIGYGKSNFCRIFQTVTGKTFHDVLNQQRVEIAGILLAQTSHSQEEIARKVGFLDGKSFWRVFKKYTGMTPGKYRSFKAE